MSLEEHLDQIHKLCLSLSLLKIEESYIRLMEVEETLTYSMITEVFLFLTTQINILSQEHLCYLQSFKDTKKRSQFFILKQSIIDKMEVEETPI